MTRAPGRPCASPDQGFTLIELLVAMTLLGILMATLYGGLRLGTRIWDASEQAVQQGNEVEIVRHFLRERFERILPVVDIKPGNRSESLFDGDQTTLRFVSFMPESFGNQPLLLELSLQSRDRVGTQKDLVLRWQPFDKDVPPGTGELTAGQRVLIDNVNEIAFGYFGGDRRQEKTWFDLWRNRPLLPALIRFELAFPKGDPRTWQPLMVSPMIDEWYDTSS